jgi:hypothetical protein
LSQLKWGAEVGALGVVPRTFYRYIKSFTADDPKPLVEGT